MTDPESLAQLRRRFVDSQETLTKEWETRLRNDPRKGAAMILRIVERRRRLNRKEGQRLRKMLQHEQYMI